MIRAKLNLMNEKTVDKTFFKCFENEKCMYEYLRSQMGHPWLTIDLVHFDNITSVSDIKKVLTRDKFSDNIHSNNPAVAAIEYALNHRTEDPLTFLDLWFYGEFDIIRKEWDDVPDEVFLGAEVGFEIKNN